MARVDRYEILLERPNGAYWAGERVRGQLILRTSQPITCRGVRVRLQGKGDCHWHTGSGDNRRDYRSHKEYVSMCRTVWGNFYRTACLNEAGANAYFGQTAGDGDVDIPLDEPAESQELLVRVMDYDWGVKDDLLGEVVVDLRKLTSEPRRFSFPLRRNGRPEQGEVTLSAEVDSSPGCAGTAGRVGMLHVHVHQATGLRKADWVGKNDVYVQMYTARYGSTDQGRALPVPSVNMVLPPGEMVVPFDFPLPNRLPPSAEFGIGDHSYIRYSVYSNIDIKWRLDPSTRRLLTIFSSDLPPPETIYPTALAVQPTQTVYKCDCCCFRCCPAGSASVTMSIDRRALCPGDVVWAVLCVKNDTDVTGAVMRLELVAHVTLQANASGMTRRGERTWVMHQREIGPRSEVRDSSPRPYTVPFVPASYGGGAGNVQRRDPLLWHFSLVLKLDMPGMMMTDPVCTVPVFVSAVPIPTLAQVLPQQYNLSGPPQCKAVTDGEPFPVGQPYPGAVPIDKFAAIPTARNPAEQAVAVPDHQEDINNWGGPPVYAPVYTHPAEPSQMVWQPPPPQCDWGGTVAGQPSSQSMDQL